MSTPSIEDVLWEHMNCTPDDDPGLTTWTCGMTNPPFPSYGWREPHLADAIRAHLAEHADEAVGAMERVRALVADWTREIDVEQVDHATSGKRWPSVWSSVVMDVMEDLRAALAGGASGATEEKE